MLVSVFIPTYNAAGCIGETLRSVLSQTYGNLEVWVVDDCSTDDTPRILDEWSARDARVHVLHKEKNEGFVPFSWNLVLPLLHGEFTLYLSHDDLLDKECIAGLVRRQQETDADCVIPEVRMWHAEPEETIIRESDWQMHGNSCLRKGLDVVDGKTAFAHMLNYDIPGFALWRTALIRETGMPTEAWNSDEGMQRVWALHCRKVAFSTTAKFYYRITPGSITKGLKPYHLTGLKTQKMLFIASLRALTFVSWPKSFIRFSWQYLKSWRYLQSHKWHYGD